MSESTVRELEAGRELDARVATEVMGWRVVHHFGALEGDGFNPRGTNYYLAPDGIKRSDLIGDWSSWHPSTDIKAAWEVVERLRSGFKYCCIALRSDFHYVWYAELTIYVEDEPEGYEHKPDFVAQAETAPLVICLAALKASDAARTQGEG